MVNHTLKEEKGKAGRKKGMTLNERDYAVLRQVAVEGVQNFAELRAKLLQEMRRDSAWKRLKQLAQAGLLTEMRGDGDVILGWSLSKEGEEELLKRGKKGWRLDCNPPRYRSSYGHDVIVREVKSILFNSPIVRTWTPEHVIRKDVMSKIGHSAESERRNKLSKIPDALFEIQISGKRYRCALEVELARKTRRRIFDRIEAHVINPDLDFVFFVVSDANHIKVLWKVYQQVLANSFRIKLQSSKNGIYFTLLNTLRKDGLHANFIGLNQTFSFSSFRI